MSSKLLVFIIFALIIVQQCDLKSYEVNLGGLFDEDGYEQHLAFNHAIDMVNSELYFKPYKLIGQGERVPQDNDFVVSKATCSLFNSGIIGVFGPTKGATAHYVQSLCDVKEIPHIEMRPDISEPRHMCMVNVYPNSRVLAQVFVDIIRAYNWKSFTILYENFGELSHVGELLKIYDATGHPIVVRELNENKDQNYRPILTEAKHAGETHFILSCRTEYLDEVLKQAQQVGILSDDYNYIIMNPDMHTIDLTPYQYGGSNITGLRFIDPTNERIARIAQELHSRKETFDLEMQGGVAAHLKFRSTTALIYDAVTLFAKSFRELNKHHTVEAKSLSCNETDNWEHGYSLINLMKTNTLNGLTGEIKFDHEGFRTDFTVDIMELTTDNLQKIGTWNSTEGLNISRPVLHGNDSDEESLQNRTFIVITALTDPYGMLKQSSHILTGNDRYEGFGIDLIEELSKMLGFNYTFRLQEDSVYGSFNKQTNQGTGMIRELMEYRADLAITDFTITSEREAGVDFTMPFMNLGISILYKKPMKMPPKLFSFTSPFSYRVWYYLGGAYFFVSILLFVIGRISPEEWTNPYPCIEDPDFLHNQFSMKNCFWFTVGSLMQQGSEIAPMYNDTERSRMIEGGIATRMVAGLWWFFTLIMVSSYTANLAAFLTVESLYYPIKNIEGLANQNVIKYGAKNNGATANFFRDSNYSIYKKIWDYMQANPDVMTPTNPIGVKRANEENYAFLMESTSIEYTVERYCNLSQVGGLLDNKGYGIAMRKNSTYRHRLSTAVLKLQESGKLAVLKNKWWKEKRGGGTCNTDSSSDGAAELSLQNVGGVFLVLGVGCGLGIITAFAEMMLGVWHRSIKNNVSFKEELAIETKFVLQFKGQTKPNTCGKSESPGESSKSLERTFPTYGFVTDLRKQSTTASNHLSNRT